MLTPERFQELILPYLYDLLEGEERRDFEAHLEVSAEARAALARARTRVATLSEAIREPHPEVAFTPPSAQPARPAAAKKSPPPVPRPKPERPPVRWARAALAACLVL